MNFSIPENLDFQQYCFETHGSIENLIDKAKKGEIVAQADLGIAYSEGFGDLLPKDEDKAIGWLNAAVERGYELPPILEKLGELLDLKGTTLCQRKAYEMYHRAAELGSTNAQINLAEMYRYGVEGVVNEDLKEAFKWYKMAADEDDGCHEGDTFRRWFAGTMKILGNALGGTKLTALKLLSKYYREGDCPEGQPQPAKAIYYLTRAAELGDVEAQLELGQTYLTGNGTMKDITKARRWLGKASASGDIRAKQLLEQCTQRGACQDDVSLPQEDQNQQFEIIEEKQKQRCEKNLHPFVIPQPVAFSEEMLRKFESYPTGRIYLQAFILSKKGFEVLYESNFTDGRGISLLAHGYLTENSILQAFPTEFAILPQIFQLCEKELQKNPCFFESLVISFALQPLVEQFSCDSIKLDRKKVMCIENLIHLIQEAEPNRTPAEDPFKFDEDYSSWLHVLYALLGAHLIVAEVFEKAAEAFEHSLECCPSDFDSKRGLGYCLMKLHDCYVGSIRRESSKESIDIVPMKMLKYKSWTQRELRDGAEKILKEYLAEAPSCWKTYPNVCYYLAHIFKYDNLKQFRKYYELGQDAEAKRLPFLNPLRLPLKDELLATYQQHSHASIRCGNSACTKKVEESKLKFCTQCRITKYCSKECQKADWKNHKAKCNAARKKIFIQL